MEAPRIVVFDLGKVLVDFDYGIASRKIAARSSLGAAGVRQMLDHAPLLFRYETGSITKQEFYAEVCRGAGFQGSLEEFCGLFADIFWEIEDMIQLQAELKESGAPTYIFSNTNDIAVGHIRQRFPFFGNFSGYILSYEHGVMKPDPKLYEIVERTTGEKGASIVYLDDRAENIATAAARGWHALLHETPEKSRAALQKLGLPVAGNK
ncbi:MAG TPA: HAD family phosphatase [Verrucomicrobiae bacterium]|jgi:FMN phosphatase YigB (HAD superfamily)|nr:HAD family phosphatase [Verrucomicrobiae bacterium]